MSIQINNQNCITPELEEIFLPSQKTQKKQSEVSSNEIQITLLSKAIIDQLKLKKISSPEQRIPFEAINSSDLKNKIESTILKLIDFL